MTRGIALWKPNKNVNGGSGPNGADKKSYRKNSNPFPIYNKVNHRQSHSSGGSNYRSGSSSSQMNYNKSSSYPNFPSSSNMGGHQQHRHSVSNLITITPSQTTASITTPSASMGQHHAAATAGLFPSTNKTIFRNSPHTVTTMSNATNTSSEQPNYQRSSSSGEDSTGSALRQYVDYNGMEYLCMKMTEQAIN